MTDSKLLKVTDYEHLRGAADPKAHLIAVGGGKGGVGKSFVSTNLAIFLANMGYNTVIIDLDLGGANVHTWLGEGTPSLGLSHFLEQDKSPLQEYAIPTKFRNLRMISGCNDSLEAADLSEQNRSRLMSAIFQTKADYIIMDLAAGTHASTLDFFLMARKHLVTFTPEPSSIENAYRFMKAAFFRRIKRYEIQLNLQSRIENIMRDHGRLGVKSPADLIRQIKKEDPENGARLAQYMRYLEFNIILNQARTAKDADLGRSIPSVCNKYFGIPAQFLGHLDYDNAVWQSLRKRSPLLLEYPHSRLYAQFMAITRDLAHAHNEKAVV